MLGGNFGVWGGMWCMDYLNSRTGVDNCGRPVLIIRLRRQRHSQEGGPLQCKYAYDLDKDQLLRLGLMYQIEQS